MSTNPVHTIRLRGPWLLSNHTEEDSPAATTRGGIGTTASEHLENLSDHVLYRRPFNCPTNLDDDEQIWLVITAWAGAIRVLINEHSICDNDRAAQPLRIDITKHLQPHNQLQVHLHSSDTKTIGITGDVTLEIHSTT